MNKYLFIFEEEKGVKISKRKISKRKRVRGEPSPTPKPSSSPSIHYTCKIKL